MASFEAETDHSPFHHRWVANGSSTASDGPIYTGGGIDCGSEGRIGSGFRSSPAEKDTQCRLEREILRGVALVKLSDDDVARLSAVVSATGLDNRGFRVPITGPQGFERPIVFALGDEPAEITERVRETLEE
jgi:hypothetical protein